MKDSNLERPDFLSVVVELLKAAPFFIVGLPFRIVDGFFKTPPAVLNHLIWRVKAIWEKKFGGRQMVDAKNEKKDKNGNTVQVSKTFFDTKPFLVAKALFLIAGMSLVQMLLVLPLVTLFNATLGAIGSTAAAAKEGIARAKTGDLGLVLGLSWRRHRLEAGKQNHRLDDKGNDPFVGDYSTTFDKKGKTDYIIYNKMHALAVVLGVAVVTGVLVAIFVPAAAPFALLAFPFLGKAAAATVVAIGVASATAVAIGVASACWAWITLALDFLGKGVGILAYKLIHLNKTENHNVIEADVYHVHPFVNKVFKVINGVESQQTDLNAQDFVENSSAPVGVTSCPYYISVHPPENQDPSSQEVDSFLII